MSDILCIYYSRTGKTKQTMMEICDSLGGELVEIQDRVERTGMKGAIRCGLDAVRKTTTPVIPFETQRPLSSYRLVVLGTPVWAGRCSAVMRSFLKEFGSQLHNVSYVLTRGGEKKYEEIYKQMDRYVNTPHKTAISLKCNSVGYHFWQNEFLRNTREFLEGQ